MLIGFQKRKAPSAAPTRPGFASRAASAATHAVMSYAFVVSMIAWMILVRPAGILADRIGRKPIMVAAWLMMTSRLLLVAFAQETWQVLVFQVLDGAANGLFSVIAGAWVMDRLADRRRAAEAQVIVGTSLVLGSALGPLLAGLIVEALGYRMLFIALAGVGLAATVLVLRLVPESVSTRDHNPPILEQASVPV